MARSQQQWLEERERLAHQSRQRRIELESRGDAEGVDRLRVDTSRRLRALDEDFYESGAAPQRGGKRVVQMDGGRCLPGLTASPVGQFILGDWEQGSSVDMSGSFEVLDSTSVQMYAGALGWAGDGEANGQTCSQKYCFFPAAGGWYCLHPRVQVRGDWYCHIHPMPDDSTGGNAFGGFNLELRVVAKQLDETVGEDNLNVHWEEFRFPGATHQDSIEFDSEVDRPGGWLIPLQLQAEHEAIIYVTCEVMAHQWYAGFAEIDCGAGHKSWQRANAPPERQQRCPPQDYYVRFESLRYGRLWRTWHAVGSAAASSSAVRSTPMRQPTE